MAAPILEETFRHWEVNEAPYPEKGGFIPRSPRETLLKALLVIGAITDSRLLELSLDPRSDIREVAARAVIESLNGSSSKRSLFVDAALNRAIPERYFIVYEFGGIRADLNGL